MNLYKIVYKYAGDPHLYTVDLTAETPEGAEKALKDSYWPSEKRIYVFKVSQLNT